MRSQVKRADQPKVTRSQSAGQTGILCDPGFVFESLL